MFNASLAESHLLEGLEARDNVQPMPERAGFRHLYSFLCLGTERFLRAFSAGA